MANLLLSILFQSCYAGACPCPAEHGFPMERTGRNLPEIPRGNTHPFGGNFKTTLVMKTKKEAIHFAHPYLINPTNPVTVHLIGAGGTGSHMLTALAKMNHALTALRRSEEHTSELQSLMRISYAFFCVNKKLRL